MEIGRGNWDKIFANFLLLFNILHEDVMDLLQILIFLINFYQFDHSLPILGFIRLFQNFHVFLQIHSGLLDVSSLGIYFTQSFNGIGLIFFEIDHLFVAVLSLLFFSYFFIAQPWHQVHLVSFCVLVHKYLELVQRLFILLLLDHSLD